MSVSQLSKFNIQQNPSCGVDRWEEPIGSWRCQFCISRCLIMLWMGNLSYGIKLLQRLWGCRFTWQTGQRAGCPFAEGGHNTVPLAGKHTGANGFRTSRFRTPKETKKVLFNPVKNAITVSLATAAKQWACSWQHTYLCRKRSDCLSFSTHNLRNSFFIKYNFHVTKPLRWK